MSTTLDILVIIVVAVFAYLGYKKGIIRTLVSAVGTFLVTILSMLLSNPIAKAIYFGGFDQTIIEKVKDASTLLKRSGSGSLMDKILETMPDYVVNALPYFNITHPQLSAAAANGPEKVEALLRPIVISFLSLIVSVVLFVILTIVVKVASKFIGDRLDDWSLGIIDSMLGGVIGLIEGFVIVLMVAFVLHIAAPHMEKVPKIISNDSISNSSVFKGVYDSPIIAAFLGDK